MAKKARKESGVKTAEEIAILLAEVRTRKAEDDKLDKVLTSAFKDALKRERLRYAGNYKLNKAMVFKISVAELALPFAIEHNAIRIDASKVHEIFRKDAAFRFEHPEKYGFEEIITERVDPIKKSEIE